MLFNSVEFGIFFLIVYFLYLILNHKWQNRILLVASYIFYGAWDWRFLSLIFLSTILDYVCGLKIYKSNNDKRRKFFLFLSVFGNLSILGFFKYFNFFASNLQVFLNNFGISLQPRFLSIILPIGISFYTFQTMSYTIDIYRKELKPTKRFFDFALFVAFFPQLVAGPIERAKRLLPQILSPRKVTLDKFYEGFCLIFLGLFQKIYIADNLAKIVDPIFAASPPYCGMSTWLALYAFAFQIFCDFAGYSNIARGLGRCMGFDIMVNFNLPYFATNARDFWKRWHISLSSWLRDYLYFPLGGNKKGTFITYRNLLIVMLLGGLWHGAAWTFVLWGAYQALLLIIYRVLRPFFPTRILHVKYIVLAKLWLYIRIVFFFNLTCIGWLFFRAQSIVQICQMLPDLIFYYGLGLGLGLFFYHKWFFLWVIIIDQLIRYRKKGLMILCKYSPVVVATVHAIMFYLMTMHATPGYRFIYFQF